MKRIWDLYHEWANVYLGEMRKSEKKITVQMLEFLPTMVSESASQDMQQCTFQRLSSSFRV